MKLDVKSLVLTSALVWGLGVFLVGVLNRLGGEYGQSFLEVLSSLYPGYYAAQGLKNLVVGTIYALVDGALMGLVFGFVYNFLVSRTAK